MSRLLYLVLCIVLMARLAEAAEPWAGEWWVAWPGGGGFLTMEQSGTDVRGTYGPADDRLEGEAVGGRLEGRIVRGPEVERVTLTLGADQTAFSGHTDSGGWISGTRLTSGESASLNPRDLGTPRAALRRFLAGGNADRLGDARALALAMDAVSFGPDPQWSSAVTRHWAARSLFEAIDRATFSLTEVPSAPPGASLDVSLPVLESNKKVDIRMVLGDDGAWRIAMPPRGALEAMLDGIAPRMADGFRALRSPRDTMRAFLDAMSRWGSGGRADAVATLDLSGIPEAIKADEGWILAQYLVRVIDRVGYLPLHAIPNSPGGREAFVYYAHPAGRIVIEPIGQGEETRWKFSRDTLEDLRMLYRAVDELPEDHLLGSRFIPPSLMFGLRDIAKAHAPALLRPVPGQGRVEYWQAIAVLLSLAGFLVLASLLRRALTWVLTRRPLKPHVRQPGRIALALGIGFAFVGAAQIMPHLGLPASVRQFSLPVVGTIVLALLTYGGWQVIVSLSSWLRYYAERTATQFDNILLTFGIGIARLALLAAAGLELGRLWSLPTTGLLAGLGISGLAVAFASKESLANLFGAGILLGDRPFRTGDRIIAGEVNGWVEEVGLRSTRIRTLHDSLMIVPNGKLADMTINNLGARRRRTLATTLLVTSGFTPERLQSFTGKIIARISGDPAFVASAAEVHVSGIAADGVQIEVSGTVQSASEAAYRDAMQNLLLDILGIAADEGLHLGRQAR